MQIVVMIVEYSECVAAWRHTYFVYWQAETKGNKFSTKLGNANNKTILPFPSLFLYIFF